VGKCARLLGRDPRLAVLMVAANPIFLLYGVGEFHNDFFMLVPTVAAIALLLAGRQRASGALLAAAVGVKFTAVLVVPFLLLASRSRRRLLVGAALAALPLALMSVALFGFSLPNLAGQSDLLTPYSVANLLGWVLGLGGGAPVLLKGLQLGVLVVAAHQLARGRDWISSAGWATVALIVSLGWLMPWYILWLLPLAALGTSVRLRRAAVALTVFLVVSFAPFTTMWIDAHGLNPLKASPVGRAALAAAHRYER
jgi:alpha-1,6-mannosyltransferase